MRFLQRSLAAVCLMSLLACGGTDEENKAPEPETRSMEVTASAYNSLDWQTQGNATLTAFGDTLKPGMKAVAVSRDLLDSGLVHNTKIYIKELGDTFTVKDKMNRRYVRKIDLYMGENLDSARAWGRKKVTISWVVEDADQ